MEIGGYTYRVDHQFKVRTYPDGRQYCVDLKLMMMPGESVGQALRRRQVERVAKIWGESGVPTMMREWSLHSFPEGPGKEEALEQAIGWADVGEGNLLLVGPTGVGKTGLAISVMQERIGQGIPSLFVSVPELLDKIRATYSGQGDFTELMEVIKTIDLLVLDDLGAHHPTQWAREKLFQIIGTRHDWGRPMVITSDRPLGDLEEAIGRRTLARIVEHGVVIEVGGRDLRR